jgi:glycosyltransferase involved in cell wall biosynthesis
MLVIHRDSDDPDVKAFVKPHPRNLVTRLSRRVKSERIARSFARYRPTRPAGYEKFSDDRVVNGSHVVRQLPPHDVITLHWIADFVEIRSLFAALDPRVPVFWKLDDMNAFTGGCHFDHYCERHRVGCGTCPQLGSNDPADLSNQVWLRKAATYGALRSDRLHIVALNEWMAGKVRQSPLLGRFALSVIPNGVDAETFAPRGTGAARALLGLPQEARVVLFSAEQVMNRRKGFALLLEAIGRLSGVRDLLLVSVGRGMQPIEPKIAHVHLGHIGDDRQLSQIYSAADVFVMASLQDNQPNTVVEAMACGTPVVGFDVGGVPELITPGLTGLLVNAADTQALGLAIADLLRCPEKAAAMGAECRRTVLSQFKLETQSQRYVDLYEAALQTRITSDSQR